MKTQSLKYEPFAGTHVGQACKEAVAMAMNESANVTFNFNGIELEATPQSSPVTLESEWTEKSEAKRKAYRESPEGIAAAQKRADEIHAKQRLVNESLKGLAGIIGDSDRLMKWLGAFARIADDIGVTYSKAELVAKLEAAGFVENEHVGEKPEWFNSRPRMAHYIVGQALNCLRRGMGPHPVTESFVDRYNRLPKCAAAPLNVKEHAPLSGDEDSKSK